MAGKELKHVSDFNYLSFVLEDSSTHGVECGMKMERVGEKGDARILHEGLHVSVLKVWREK